ncbi:unnamed protein product [Urochloa decumbens]|uniref:Aminotransferase-like plant mobile domain-containing protein n=1 Tax=Urochloa decumbens TaxID=240449 RepID=A0ABC8WE48_9POAL
MAHHPRYPLLEMFYDEQHRGKKLEDRTQVLRPLRIRTHNPLAWDDRYASYLKRAGFIALAMLVKDGLPNMDNAALTALIDRWRPETHTFHLSAGEMTVTLQDVALLFGLRIDGRAVTGNINPAGWRDMVEALLGVRPADPPEDAKDRKTTGVHSSWLSQHFGTPPPDADEAVVERRSGDSPNLGGCAYLLQLWMWEHLPVGRPQRYAHGALPTYDRESVATVGYLWHNMLNVHGNLVRRYVDYSNALDCLSHSHVTWEPYNRAEVQNMQLSPFCQMDEDYWRLVCPLICFYIVEYHIPSRVMHQFGHLQSCPPEHIDTNKELHGIDRRKQRGAKDWGLKHQGHVNAWNARAGNLVYGGTMHRDGLYQAYLDWLKANTRLKLKVAMDAQHIEDLASDPDDVFDEYDDLTRRGTQPQRGPLEDYIGLQIGCFANESQQALSVPIGDPDEASRLHAYLQRFHRGCRKIAYKLNCMAPSAQAEAVEPSSHLSSYVQSRCGPN